MILGRPTNLWLGLITAVAGLASTLLVVAGVDPTVVAQIIPPTVTVLGIVVALVANQPPSLEPGDAYTIVTPKGQPNYDATVAPPPAPTRPTPDLSPKG